MIPVKVPVPCFQIITIAVLVYSVVRNFGVSGIDIVIVVVAIPGIEYKTGDREFRDNGERGPIPVTILVIVPYSEVVTIAVLVYSIVRNFRRTGMNIRVIVITISRCI